MSGPTASVLFRERLTPLDHMALRGCIDAVSDHDLSKPPAPDAFWAADTRLIGGSYSGDGRPFAIQTGLQSDQDLDCSRHVHSVFGFVPNDELLVIAFCNGNDDHRVLGELCVRFAERFEGVVDFGGALWPSVPASAGIDSLRADWREVEPYFQEMVTGMPGRVSGLQYETQSGRQWVVHFADAVFARAWLNHPRFRMVK